MPRDVFRLAFSTRMSAENSDEGELMLYGEIVQDYGKLYKEYFPNDKCAVDFDSAVKELKNKGAKRLALRINSPGGIVSEAVAMRSILTGANFENINIRIEGVCASAATILASIPSAHVTIAPGSEYMIHNPWSWAMGNANEIEKTVQHLRSLETTCRGFYSAKTGQGDDTIKQWMDDETWFNAEDAVKYGFADEVAKESEVAAEAVACVTGEVMAVMKGLYKAVPEKIAIKDMANNNVSNDAPIAGVPTENKIHEEDTQNMDIKDLNMDQLRAENPGLLDSIRQEAITAERQRCDDIDALTLPGYENMAAQAKANGTSALDFQKQVVQAQRQKGADFIKNRQNETAPSADVTGGAPSGKTEEQEIQDAANDIAKYAKQYSGNDAGGMY